jgi:hypothetical protein
MHALTGGWSAADTEALDQRFQARMPSRLNARLGEQDLSE